MREFNEETAMEILYKNIEYSYIYQDKDESVYLSKEYPERGSIQWDGGSEELEVTEYFLPYPKGWEYSLFGREELFKKPFFKEFQKLLTTVSSLKPYKSLNKIVKYNMKINETPSGHFESMDYVSLLRMFLGSLIKYFDLDNDMGKDRMFDDEGNLNDITIEIKEE